MKLENRNVFEYCEMFSLRTKCNVVLFMVHYEREKIVGVKIRIKKN